MRLLCIVIISSVFISCQEDSILNTDNPSLTMDRQWIDIDPLLVNHFINFENAALERGFDVDLIREGADNQGVYNEGGAFTPAAMKLIQQAQIGDKYFFSDIKVREVDGTTRDLEQDMLFEIQ